MRKDQKLHELFVDELEDMLSCEKQIIETLPKLLRLASSNALKEALAMHLDETLNQLKRLEQIFSILGLQAKEKPCKGMKGILGEGDEMFRGKSEGPLLDAIIISAAQKVEHYEIASYGTLRSFAKHLELDRQVIDLIQTNLDEEGAADKKLTKLAEGGFFTDGINAEAAHSSKNHK